jgi:hypothetical protein
VGNAVHVAQQIREGAVDLGLTFTMAPDADIKVEFAQRAPIMAVMRPDRWPSRSRSRTGALPAGHAAEEHHHAPPDRRLLQPPQCAAGADHGGRLHQRPAVLRDVGQGIGFSAALPIRKLVRAGQLAALPIRDKDMNTLQLEIQSLVAALLPNAARAFLNTLISGPCRPVLGLFASSLAVLSLPAELCNHPKKITNSHRGIKRMRYTKRRLPVHDRGLGATAHEPYRRYRPGHHQ